jgi:formylglycine-generating enzyme
MVHQTSGKSAQARVRELTPAWPRISISMMAQHLALAKGGQGQGLCWVVLVIGCATLAAACTPPSPERAQACPATPTALALETAAQDSWALIPAGRYRLGSADFGPEEGPVREVMSPAFRIARFEVTNLEFAAFVAATGYQTLAERGFALPGSSQNAPPGSLVFSPPRKLRNFEDIGQWWRFVPGAWWRHPEGPSSSLDGRMRDPVVHLAYADAQAYARWRGARLPSQDEWEIAARGGLVGAAYVWGEAPHPDGQQRANTWQGVFPLSNTAADGWRGTAPVGCFAPNGYGLYDMAGNVWEWTSTPFGAEGRSIKGGSFLCAPNFCGRFRPAARQAGDAGAGTSHIGFRIAADAH